MNINVAVEANPSIIDKMVDAPGSDYRVKLVQRDATYLGDLNDSRDVNFIFKIFEHEKTSAETLESLIGQSLTPFDITDIKNSYPIINGGYSGNSWSLTDGDVFASGPLITQD